MTIKPPQVGQRYRNTETTFRDSVWLLTDIFVGPHGIEHARITSTHDHTERRTLALSVLADTSRFKWVETADRDIG
jgi:hypothetical protein